MMCAANRSFCSLFYGGLVWLLFLLPSISEADCVTDLSARVKPEQVQLVWTHQSDNTRYDIYRATESTPQAFAKIAETTSTYATYLDTSVTNEVTYLYKVVSLFSDQTCDSNVVSVHPTTSRVRGLNYPPVIYSTAPVQADVNAVYNYAVEATDPNNDVLSYSLLTAPSGMTINAGNGLIQWLPAQAGDFNVEVQVNDGQGGVDNQTFTITVAPPPNQPPTANAGPDGTVNVGDVVRLDGSGSSDPETSTLSYEWSFYSVPVGSRAVLSASSIVNPAFVPDIAGTYVVQLVVNDGTDNSLPDDVTINAVGPSLPPDPTEVAPQLDTALPTTTFAASEFLYTGESPIQTGVAEGVIAPQRVAVVSGRVIDRDETALAGVVVTVLNHPEFGQTLSRLDGKFDMAVNGGGLLTFDYRKPGFIRAQRQFDIAWDSAQQVPDVILIPLDPVVTTINLSASDMQVARGGEVVDEDGSRQATVLVPGGTSAELVMPDGSTQAIANLHVRATEYTVGSSGPATMPAQLPASSAYTYAVELSADEALAAGASEVRFNHALMVSLTWPSTGVAY